MVWSVGWRELVHVDADDLGATTLQFESPEAVEGADVQSPKAAQVRGQGGALDVRAKVDETRGGHPGRDLDHVVPVMPGCQQLCELRSVVVLHADPLDGEEAESRVEVRT